MVTDYHRAQGTLTDYASCNCKTDLFSYMYFWGYYLIILANIFFIK